MYSLLYLFNREYLFDSNVFITFAAKNDSENEEARPNTKDQRADLCRESR